MKHVHCDVCRQEKSKVNFLMVDGASTEDKPLKIPKEVWILVNHLFTKSCDQVRGLQLRSTWRRSNCGTQSPSVARCADLELEDVQQLTASSQLHYWINMGL